MSKHHKSRTEQRNTESGKQQTQTPSNVTPIRGPSSADVRSSSTQVPVEELVRRRAYEFYEQRGRQDGHAQEDWIRAEAEVVGTVMRRARLEPRWP